MTTPIKALTHLPTLTHNIYDKKEGFKHSLSVNGEESLKVSWNQIARNGIYCAVTPYYIDYFPEVFMVTNFSSIADSCIIQDHNIRKTTKII